MKLWISDTKTPSHRIVKFNCEDHSGFNDDELRSFLLELQDNMDVDKNIKLIKYYGYLHLLIVK